MSVEQDAECRPVVGLTAGVDWASADHAVAVVDGAGVVRDRFVVAHRAAELRGWSLGCAVLASGRWRSNARTARSWRRCSGPA